MRKKKKKFKYFLNSNCKHDYTIAKIFNSKPKNEKDYGLKGKYLRKYFKCKICEHHISDHNYDLNSLYSKKYVEAHYGNYNDLKKNFYKIKNLKSNNSDNYKRCLRINSFFKKINKKIKTLDVGAGLGVFADRLKSAKFQYFSLIETNNLNVKFLKEFLKFKKTFKKKSDLKSNKFDLITMNKVIEHVPKPTTFVKNYLKYLKSNGIIYIEVPNVDAKHDPINFERQEFFIEHHHVFSKLSLLSMLFKLKLKILKIKKIKEPSSKYTIFCFAQKTEI